MNMNIEVNEQLMVNLKIGSNLSLPLGGGNGIK